MMEREIDPLSHAELRRLSEAELLAMRFDGASAAEIRRRQAAHELGRRKESRAFKVQLFFMALATIAALGSAIAAIMSTFGS